MKLSPGTMPLAALFLLLSAAGCSSIETTPNPVDDLPVAVDEADIRAPRFSGSYRAVSSDDEGFFGDTVTITQRGPKLILELGQTELPLTKVRSGAYVFDSGDLSGGDCDNPGCHLTTKISGVVYLKREGSAKRPAVKVNVRLVYPFPEYDGDLEGEHTTTVRFTQQG